MGTVLVHYPRNGGSGPERLLCKGTAPDDIREGISMLKRKIAPAAATSTFRYLDLFCGCGGFSLGIERAGLACVAAIDIDQQAIDVFKTHGVF